MKNRACFPKRLRRCAAPFLPLASQLQVLGVAPDERLVAVVEVAPVVSPGQHCPEPSCAPVRRVGEGDSPVWRDLGPIVAVGENKAATQRVAVTIAGRPHTLDHEHHFLESGSGIGHENPAGSLPRGWIDLHRDLFAVRSAKKRRRFTGPFDPGDPPMGSRTDSHDPDGRPLAGRLVTTPHLCHRRDVTAVLKKTRGCVFELGVHSIETQVGSNGP
jgi:hypothetical protein